MENSNCTSPYTSAEIHASTSLNACSGFLSVIGSLVIIYIILSGGQTKLCRVHNRLLLGISVIDVLNSIALSLSIIPSPRLDDCSYGKGNQSSCTVQGFFLTLGLAVPGYTMMLSMYYLATIAYNTSEETIAQKYEPFMHAYAVLPALCGASIGAAKTYFFSQTGQCWIEDPCLSSGKCVGTDIYGDGRWLLVAAMVWTLFNNFAVGYCMIAIYRKVRGRATTMRKYVFRNTHNRPNRIEMAVDESARQALLYISAYILTYMWPGISCVLTQISDKEQIRPVIYILTAIFYPLQGFWNCIAYIRPRFVKHRREQENLSFFSTLSIIIFGHEGAPDPLSIREQQRRQSLALYQSIHCLAKNHHCPEANAKEICTGEQISSKDLGDNNEAEV